MRNVNNQKKRINKYMEEEERRKARHDEEIIEDRKDRLIEIFKDKLLDFIEEEVNKDDGVYGMDGETLSDILSYYLDNDPRFHSKLEKELKKIGKRP
ncbi:MAG: hypothetical protein RR192_01785 [Peptostreptococcaceae bacterium]